jgi:hypothetical protein
MAQPAYPLSREDRVKVYLLIMEEIKTRLSVIRTIKAENLPFPIAREVCTLQLRHICELIAIGCLVVQGKLTADIAQEDNPIKIMRTLEEVVPHFFPQPAIITKDGNILDIEFNSKPKALTRKELETIWGQSGNYLHRLTVKRFFSKKSDPENPWEDIDSQIDKVEALLADHGIAILEPKTMYLVSLVTENGHAAASVMNYNQDGTISVTSFNQVDPPSTFSA